MTVDRTCTEAAEYVSALCDGETIPRDAARHIGECTACQGRLHDYLAIGAELRRVASLECPESVPALHLQRRSRFNRFLWQKGTETMRIPKFAFALLVVVVLALASSLAVFTVGAHSSGTVLRLKVALPGRPAMDCFIDTLTKDYPCSFFSGFDHGTAGFEFHVLAHAGDRVQLGVRAQALPDTGPAGNHVDSSELAREPQTQYPFEVGQTLNLNVDNLGTVAVNGEWTDHVPTLNGQIHIDPGPDELRMVSPLLLRDKQVLGDLEGGTALAAGASEVVWINLPDVGRILVSVAPMKGAVQAYAQLNRISFQADGRHYVILTGAPVTRGNKVWVLLEPGYKFPGDQPQSWIITSGELKQIAPEAVVSSESAPRN